jgi:serine/threonine protein kinase/WD40 repeat protein
MEDPPNSLAGLPPLPSPEPEPVDLERQRQNLLDKMFGLGEQTRIEQYELLGEIGRGAMGIVYVALDHNLGRKVAIKRVQDRGNLELRRHLVREAQAMAQLAHPNVVSVHEIREHDDETFIVMEYVDGVTLSQWLRQKPRAVEEVLEVFMAAGVGLAAAHSRGLVHRDFKPANVMLGVDRRVRVMDFGLACPDPGKDSTVGFESDASRRDSGAIAGTPVYMAPEHFRGRWTDARGDQFSFCVALHEALYGERPFAGSTLEQIWAAAERGEIRPEPRHTSVPKWLREVVVRGLHPDPRCRFESMQAIVDALGTKRQTQSDVIDFTEERRRHKHFFAREDILAELDAMLQGVSGWLVLTGQPGLGKSAIFNEWLCRRESARLPTAVHFIRRGDKNWSDPAAVRANLVAQIEQHFPEQRDPTDEPSRLEHLLDRVRPVLEERRVKLVLLVDGLDEAMSLDDKDNLIPQIFPREVPACVFVLVGSRPRYPKLNWFDRRSGPSSRIDLDARKESNENAVQAYWEARRSELSPPVNNELIRVAVERASGNLLHAVKLFEQWSQPNADRRTETIPQGFLAMLDELWERLAELPKGNRRRVHAGLAMLCAAREPLPFAVLESLLGWEPGDAQDELLPIVREMLLEEHWHDPPRYGPFHEGFRELVAKRLSGLVQTSHETISKVTPQSRVTQQLAIEQRPQSVTGIEDRSQKGSEARTLIGHFGTVGAVALLPDGRIVSASDDGALLVWDLEAGHPLASEGHQNSGVVTLALLPNGAIVSSELARPPKSQADAVLHRKQGSCSFILINGLHVPIVDMAVLPDGRIVSTLTDYLRVWDLESRRSRILHGPRGPVRVLAMAILPNGRIAFASRDSFGVWDSDSGYSFIIDEGNNQSIRALASLPDGRIVSASDDDTLRVWDTNFRDSRVLDEGNSQSIRALVTLPDGRMVSTGFTPRVWDLDSGHSRALEGHQSLVWAVALLSDGRIVSASFDATLRVWDLDSGHSRALKGHRGPVFALAVLPDGRIVSASADCTLRVWDLDSGHSRALEGHQGSVFALTLLPDGRIVSASEDCTLRVWDLDSFPRLAHIDVSVDGG